MNTRIYRPVGLVVVVFVTAFFAALGLILSGFVLILAPAAKMSGGEILLIALYFGLSTMEAAAAYGLWSFQDWGLGLAKLVFVLDILVSAAAMFFDASSGNVIVSLIFIGVTVWMLSYISKEDVAALFGVRAVHHPRSDMKDRKTTLKSRDHFID